MSPGDRTQALARRLAELPSLAVAFSGGVDSAVLLHAAVAALGSRAFGVLADSPSLPRRELTEARALADWIGAELIVVSTQELADGRYRRNASDRCYWCKEALFDAMQLVAAQRGVATLAFGEIADDLMDDRPGARSANERGVIAPLRDAGFSKADVRRYARSVGLPAAEKPASACLASRLAKGMPVTRADLARVERAEVSLRALGVGGVLRVRHRGVHARVEVEPPEIPRLRSRWREAEAALRAEGFTSASLAHYSAPGAPA